MDHQRKVGEMVVEEHQISFQHLLVLQKLVERNVFPSLTSSWKIQKLDFFLLESPNLGLLKLKIIKLKFQNFRTANFLTLFNYI